jgi:hypothetical protein
MPASRTWPHFEIAELLPGLFMGGTDDDHVIGRALSRADLQKSARHYPFDVVVTLFVYAMPAPSGIEEIRYGFPDTRLDESTIPALVRISGIAYDRWMADQRVFIRCQSGINRSGLVAALVLMRSGLDAQAAIRLIRRERDLVALCNEHFERFLLEDAAALLAPHRQFA